MLGMVGETSGSVWRPQHRRDSSHSGNEDLFPGAPAHRVAVQNDAGFCAGALVGGRKFPQGLKPVPFRG